MSAKETNLSKTDNNKKDPTTDLVEYVVCKSDCGIYLNELTPKNKYKVLDSIFWKIFILNDRGEKTWYPKEYFFPCGNIDK